MSEIITTLPKLPPRRPDAHKGDFGRILVIGGSRGMIGAPALAGLSALRSGAGLVRLAVPHDIQLAVAAIVPCATTIPLTQDQNGYIAPSALPTILDAMTDNNVVALGPGLGRSEHLKQIIAEIITHARTPLVIDADGLNNLADLWAQVPVPLRPDVILTPHPGEMRRLWLSAFKSEPPADRTQQAETLAKHTHAVVVLKGANTVVTNGQKTYINNTGNPGLATGGSGDVLTGVIAALAARLSPFDAAVLATHAHGAAGDLAAEKIGQTALIASDIIDALPAIWRAIE